MKNLEEVIDCVLKGTENFEDLARKNGVDSFHIELISKRLQELRPEGRKMIRALPAVFGVLPYGVQQAETALKAPLEVLAAQEDCARLPAAC